MTSATEDPTPSLESLITSHTTKLHSLSTLLSPTPQILVTTCLSSLRSSLEQLLSTQLSSLEQQISQLESLLSLKWSRIHSWRTALGEPPLSEPQRSKGQGADLETLIQEAEEQLQAMRRRMEKRGRRIMQVQQRLMGEYRPALGREWFKVELDWCLAGGDRASMSNDGGARTEEQETSPGRQEEASESEEQWEHLDLRLERLQALDLEEQRARVELTHRTSLLSSHLSEIHALRLELGLSSPSSASSSSSSSSSSPLHPRKSLNGPDGEEWDDVDEMIDRHLGLSHGLGLGAEGEGEGKEEGGESRDKRELMRMVPTEENLKRVEEKRRWLEAEKTSRNALIQSTYDQLYPLWSLLGVSEREMDEFVNCWMGSGMECVEAYQSELTRMLTLKRSNLSSFILRERTLLTSLWDTLFLSPSERIASFPLFEIDVAPRPCDGGEQQQEEEEMAMEVNENVSEELLLAHERERERVERVVEEGREVLSRVGRYFACVEEGRELEASAADPSRLLGKSTRGDPGRLLREEKARKRVAKERPKLELELRQIIPQWEAEHGRPFLVNGVRFLDELDAKAEAEAMEKENKKRTKLGPTPSTRPLRPQATGGASTSTMVPIKRQMTGRSASSSTSASTSGQPAAKRQTAMAAGTRGALGERNGRPQHQQQEYEQPPPHKLHPQATGRSALGSSQGSSSGGGMRIPAGWGAPAQGIVDTSAHHSHAGAGVGGGGYQLPQQGMIRPQMTGGFRPRGSGMSR